MIDGRRLRSAVRHGLGWQSLLWVPTLVLLAEGLAPRARTPGLLAGLGLGLALQGALYLVSHRGPFARGLPPARVIARAAFLAAAGATAVLGAVLAVGLVLGGGPGAARPWYLALAWAQLVAIFAGVFRLRFGYSRSAAADERVRQRARAAARLLVPLGPLHLGRILGRVEAIAEQAGGRGATAAELSRLARDLAVGCDPRFDRRVPWGAASALVAAFVERLRREHEGRVRLSFHRRDRSDALRLRPALPCALLDAATGVATEVDLVSREEGGRLVVAVELRGPGAAAALRQRVPRQLVEQLDAALADGTSFGVRENGANGSILELRFGDGATAGAERCAVVSVPPLDGLRPRPNSSTALVRQGETMFKIRFDEPWDPKPTLVTEQFLMLERLAGAASCFPEPTGLGRGAGCEWLAYRHEPGESLEAWLAASAENRAQWFRLLVEVDAIASRLAEHRIAHRDLNPGNFVVRPDGSLVLVDFDQAVADAAEFLTADASGAERGLARTDLPGFVERAGLAASANAAVARLSAFWDERDSPWELVVAGHRFGGRVPWDLLWGPLCRALGPLAGRRVLEWGSRRPLFAVFAAASGASVSVVTTDDAGAAWLRRMAEAAAVEIEVIAPGSPPPAAEFDLALCLLDGGRAGLGPCPSPRVARTLVPLVESPPEGRVVAYTARLDPLVLLPGDALARLLARATP